MRRLPFRIGSSALLTLVVATGALAQAPATSDFVLFAGQGIRAHGLSVQTGAVGTNGTLVATKRIDAAKSTLVAASAALDPASTCQALLANAGGGAALCGPAQPLTLPVVPDVGAACGAPNPPPAPCTAAPISVLHDATTVLSASNGGSAKFGSIKVYGGGEGPGTLVLNAGSYTICGDLRVGRNGRVLSRGGPVTITVLGSIYFQNGSEVRPESSTASACQLRIVALGTKARVSRRGDMRGFVCAPNARLELASGSTLQGAFFAQSIKTDRATANLVRCSGTTSTTSTTQQTTTTAAASSTTSTSTSTTHASTTASTGTVPSTTSSSSTTLAQTTTTTSSTAIGSTSSTTTTPSTTSTSAAPSTTSTSQPFQGQPASAFDFLSTAASGSCGSSFRNLDFSVPLKNLLCGNLSLGGGSSSTPDNPTPAGATNRMTLACNGASCDVGPVPTSGSGFDCTATGCRFGTPLPLVNGGLSVCVENAFSQNVSGTLDRATGSAALNFQLRSRTILTTIAAQPCPICRVGTLTGVPCAGTPDAPCTGVCEGSPNQGAACISTNPNGLTGMCPGPAATAGVQKCYRGSNNGATCSTGADCPAGACAQFVGDIPISLNPLTTGTSTLTGPGGVFCNGQGASQKGAFKSDVCSKLSLTNSGGPCTAATAGADCGAGIACRSGTLTNYCNGGTNDGKGCNTSTDCPSGGVCVRAGTMAQAISTAGVPAGPLTNTGVATPVKLASVFCVGATDNAAVNANANLPGPGATALVGTIKLIP